MLWIIIGFSLLWLIDFKPLLQRKCRRGAIAFVVLFIGSLTLAVLQTMNIEVPSIMMFLGEVLKSIGLYYPS